MNRQKAVTALLHKITPEEFETISEDLANVGYETEETVLGLIDQVSISKVLLQGRSDKTVA